MLFRDSSDHQTKEFNQVWSKKPQKGERGCLTDQGGTIDLKLQLESISWFI